MIKLFVTGDNHIGRKFDKYASIKQKLVESRFCCLEDMVNTAEKEKCDFIVVTGDLFDNTYAIPKKDIKRVVDTLGEFSQRVLILPGNHDYYSGSEALWDIFIEVAGSYSNLILLDKYEKYDFDCDGGNVNFYPAHCDSKHSASNRLDWIKKADIDANDCFNVGVAHGALEGLAIDAEGVYFPMTRAELNGIKMDAWLIGHAHVTEPAIPAGEEKSGFNIFNAGTHEQLDLHNQTEGNAFVITLDNTDGVKRVFAKRVITGNIRYFDEKIRFNASENKGLEEAVQNLVKEYPSNSIVRIALAGSVSPEEYVKKDSIYDAVLSRFMEYRVIDGELSEKITKEKIENEFSEIGFAAKFLEELADDPIALQMAYDVVNSVKK